MHGRFLLILFILQSSCHCNVLNIIDLLCLLYYYCLKTSKQRMYYNNHLLLLKLVQSIISYWISQECKHNVVVSIVFLLKHKIRLSLTCIFINQSLCFDIFTLRRLIGGTIIWRWMVGILSLQFYKSNYVLFFLIVHEWML